MMRVVTSWLSQGQEIRMAELKILLAVTVALHCPSLQRLRFLEARACCLKGTAASQGAPHENTCNTVSK